MILFSIEMTAKSNKGVRLETDIEKCREESNWKKVIELSEQLKSKHNSQGLVILRFC